MCVITVKHLVTWPLCEVKNVFTCLSVRWFLLHLTTVCSTSQAFIIILLGLQEKTAGMWRTERQIAGNRTLVSMEIQDKKNQNTQWDDTEKKNNTQPFIYLYISSAHGQTLSMCEKTKNKKTKFRVLISPGSSPEQWGRADSVCYKISSGSRSNAVHTSLYLSSLFVAH